MFINNNSLFKITTQQIVIQKKLYGKELVSVIANIMVNIKTTTAMLILHTIRVVKLPLKIKEIFILTKYINLNK